MRSLNVALPDEAAAKLRELATREFRGPRQQAAVLILDGLKRAGLDNPETRSGDATAHNQRRQQ